MSTLESRVLYGLPALSGLAIAFALLGPGARRAVEGARVYGVPVFGAKRFSVRVETLTRYGDLESPSAGPVAIEWRADRVVGRAAANAGADGFVELGGDLDEALPSTVVVAVMRGERVLLEANVTPRRVLSVVPSRRCEVTGDVETLEVCVERGVAVPESPEPIRVTRRSHATARAARATLEVRASGADVVPLRVSPGPLCDGATCTESWMYTVTARAPAVSLDVELVADGTRVPYHGDLPLQPGGIWLDPASRRTGTLAFRSATPRAFAYVSLLSEHGRVWGGILPLSEGPNGMATARLPVSAMPPLDAGPMTMLVASDPTEPSNRVAAWPLGPGDMVEAVPLETLGDGLPGALAREAQRRASIRRPIAGLVLVSALAVMATLVMRVRREKRRLEAHLAGRGEPLAIADTRLGFGLGVLASLALAFAVLALVAAYG